MTYLRGSEIGLCPRYLQLKLGGEPMEPPSHIIRKVFEDSGAEEEATMAWVEETYHTQVTDRQREVVWEPEPGMRIVGHIDGLLVDVLPGPKTVLLEAKSMSAERFHRLRASGQLEWRVQCQVTAYCLGLGSEVAGAWVVAKLWGRNRYFVWAQNGSTFTSWLADTGNILREKVQRVYAGSNPLAEPGWRRQAECNQCPARFHCYPERLR
jgi:hypothetical protein